MLNAWHYGIFLRKLFIRIHFLFSVIYYWFTVVRIGFEKRLILFSWKTVKLHRCECEIVSRIQNILLRLDVWINYNHGNCGNHDRMEITAIFNLGWQPKYAIGEHYNLNNVFCDRKFFKEGIPSSFQTGMFLLQLRKLFIPFMTKHETIRQHSLRRPKLGPTAKRDAKTCCRRHGNPSQRGHSEQGFDSGHEPAWPDRGSRFFKWNVSESVYTEFDIFDCCQPRLVVSVIRRVVCTIVESQTETISYEPREA